MKELRIVKVLGRLENATSLDPLVEKVRSVVNRTIQPQAVRDVLHGVPIGHPLHPLAILIPAGAWVSAAVLDVVPDTARAARILVAVGVVSAAPASLTGFTDWSKLRPDQARVGIIHSAANLVAIALYGASYVQRRRGHQTSGKVLAYAGLAVISGSGFLGGHLSYRQAAGANHTDGVTARFPDGWQTVGPLDDVPENELTRRQVAGQPLLILRRGASVDVLSDLCSHLAGPLSGGKLLDGDTDNPCVSCPWHDSVFELRTGEVVHGPATAPQPKFDTRVLAGVLEVRSPVAE